MITEPKDHVMTPEVSTLAPEWSDTPSEVVTLGSSQARLPLALQDLSKGLSQWWMWSAMAWQDILQRYRGSMLGPFWLTLSMAITIVALGILYSNLFKVDIQSYLPFLCLGMISWTLLSSILQDGCYAFINAENIIKQIRIPFSAHVYRVIYRNLLIAAHNIVVYVVVMLYFDIGVSAVTLLVFVGIAAVVINGVWICLLLGMICARFRDVPQIVISLVQVVFFVSPIIWRPELLGDRLWLARLNPAYGFIDVLRAPLLNTLPDPASWATVLGVTVVGWTITLAMFTRFRARLPYWV